MVKQGRTEKEFGAIEPEVPLGIALLLLLGVTLGTIAGVLALQTWWPGLAQSLIGAQPKAYWDLARTSGIVAYLLIWLSVAFGLIITNRFARLWPGGPVAFDLHQFASVLGLAFAAFHGLILLGDQYIGYTLPQIVIPFATSAQSFWVGLGQLAFYALIPIAFSFYFRRQIGTGVWRAIHYGSFITFALVTVHGLLAGSDATNPGVFGIYALTSLSVLFLTLYRIGSLRHAPA